MPLTVQLVTYFLGKNESKNKKLSSAFPGSSFFYSWLYIAMSVLLMWLGFFGLDALFNSFVKFILYLHISCLNLYRHYIVKSLNLQWVLAML